MKELESYKSHHKTCLELAEEANQDITLERRANSSLRAKVDQATNHHSGTGCGAARDAQAWKRRVSSKDGTFIQSCSSLR